LAECFSHQPRGLSRRVPLPPSVAEAVRALAHAELRDPHDFG
jgi:hypothetical protein